MMRQTGIIKIAQFDSAIEFYSRPTPCSYSNQVAVFEQKIGCSSAV